MHIVFFRIMHLPFDFTFDTFMSLAWYIAVAGHGAWLAVLLYTCLKMGHITFWHQCICLSIYFKCSLHISLTDWRFCLKLWSNVHNTQMMHRTYNRIVWSRSRSQLKVKVEWWYFVSCVTSKPLKELYTNIKHHTRRYAEKRKSNLSTSFDIIMPFVYSELLWRYIVISCLLHIFFNDWTIFSNCGLMFPLSR